ncbi:acyl-CoA carboxylase subunit epsilon [Streptomyces chiangmaiensis]|uniref:Acyl-CoA carboxylase subunit epsilon n=1 Tax=Streptomyces chiangmaiensis TaxID=766497 RepID=A0ABU7FJB7_9ACTN|nr:acyl-CoA carboxylase subunit epsilon [Streptomyces chiangmaiensis]MED7824217.1 acyl-CoA carboxylase subunit epsilon [Streptomyces chiangmaiensis]
MTTGWEPSDGPVLQVLRGNPDPTELAAVTALLAMALSSPTAAGPTQPVGRPPSWTRVERNRYRGATSWQRRS